MQPTKAPSQSPNAGAIIGGGVAGGLALIVITGFIIYSFRRYRNHIHTPTGATTSLELASKRRSYSDLEILSPLEKWQKTLFPDRGVERPTQNPAELAGQPISELHPGEKNVNDKAELSWRVAAVSRVSLAGTADEK
ncbi:MAG: hypothetical protein Q9227_008550 [Pyrenula ochraceoflavens]